MPEDQPRRGPDEAGQPRRSRGPDDSARAARAAEALAAARADSLARGNHPAPPGPAVGPRGQPAGPAGGAAGDAAAAPGPGPGQTGPGQAGAGGAGPGQAGPGQPAAAVPRPRARRRPRRDDPQPLNSAIEGLIDERGWGLAAATGSVFGRWAQIVGPDLAAHTKPESLTDGELTVTADSTAWATQVRLLAAQLVRRLNTELGDGAVKRVKVRGPTVPRQAGQWRVRGGRGPRDTYG